MSGYAYIAKNNKIPGVKKQRINNVRRGFFRFVVFIVIFLSPKKRGAVKKLAHSLHLISQLTLTASPQGEAFPLWGKVAREA